MATTCFCERMFYGCDNANFKVNASFRFPRLAQVGVDNPDNFYQMFYCSTNKTYPRQNISATTIINGNPTPSTYKGIFFTYNATQGANRWSDYNSLAAAWK